MFPTIEHPSGPFRTVAAPDAHQRRRHPPARPGAERRRPTPSRSSPAIGFDPGEIDALTAAGIVGTG